MTYDAIIVLGNLMDSAGILNDESRSRMDTCILAYLGNEAPKIITCGWNYREDSDIKIADAMKAYAIDKGVPNNSIIAEINSRDTVGDAIFSKVNVAEPNGMKKLLVVTSNYHLERTLEIFRFIYGENFILEGRGAPSEESDLLRESEAKSMDAFRKTFHGICAGSTAMIVERLATRHPYYNGDKFPKFIFKSNGG